MSNALLLAACILIVIVIYKLVNNFIDDLIGVYRCEFCRCKIKKNNPKFPYCSSDCYYQRKNILGGEK